MISKFNGTCCYCNEPTKAGKDIYDLDMKKSYHQACKDEDEAQPDPEQWDLADRLGFVNHPSVHLLISDEQARVWINWRNQ